MTTQVQHTSALPDFTEAPKTHFEITRKATTDLLAKLIRVKSEGSPLMSPPPASRTPCLPDNISLESKSDDEAECETNILIPWTQGASQFPPNAVTTDVSKDERETDQEKATNTSEGLFPAIDNIQQQTAKVQTCLKNLEDLNRKLLKKFLDKVSTDEEVMRNRQLKMESDSESAEIELPPPAVATEKDLQKPAIINQQTVSPQSKIKQELLKIKTDLQNKLAGGKQTDKCTTEIDVKSNIEAELKSVEDEIETAKQGLLTLRTLREELLGRKLYLERTLPQQTMESASQPENQIRDRALQKLEAEKLNLRTQLEKIIEEKNSLERRRSQEKQKFVVMAENLEQTISHLTTLMPWLQDVLPRQETNRD